MLKLIKGDKMNNKGFTLVELLATIVILGVIMGIASYGVITAINNSKIKSERLFTEKIGDAIQGYLYYSASKELTEIESTYTFTKCTKLKSNGECEEEKNVNAKELKEITEGNTYNDVVLSKITNNSLKTLNKNDLINPKTKMNCVEGKDPTIRVFKDSDYVYYYYLDLSGDKTSCEISDENAIVTNIPKGLCTVLSGTYDNEKGCKLNET